MPSLARLLCSTLLLTAAILCSAFSTGYGQLPDAKPVKTGSISGRVTVGDKAAPGIMVVVLPGNGYNRESPVAQATTDSDGNYRLSKIPAGQFTIIPIAPVFVLSKDSSSFGGKPLVLSEAETVEGIDFKLTRGGVISGRVTDADNRPVIEERVLISAVDEKGAPARMQMSMPSNYQMYQTDDRGVYRVYGLPAGRYTISVGDDSNNTSFGMRRSGFYQRTYHPDVSDPKRATVIEVAEGTEARDVDIKLGRRAPTYTASGRVVDAESGQPVTGVGVGLGIMRNNNGENYLGGMVGSGPTNARGEFKLVGLQPGRYGIYLEGSSADKGSGFYSDPVLFEVAESDVGNLEVKAQHGLSLSGVVVLEGEPNKATAATLSKMTVYVNIFGSDHLHAESGGTSPISSSGSFRINALRPGKGILRLFSREGPGMKGFQVTRIEHDGVRLAQGIEIQSGENLSGISVVVALGTGVIRGQVKTDGGRLPEGTQLWVGITRDGTPLDRGAQVDTRGRFVVDSLPAGTYELTLQGNFYGPAKTGERRPPPPKQIVTVGEGSEVEVVFTLDLGEKKETP